MMLWFALALMTGAAMAAIAWPLTRQARSLRARLENSRMEEIFQTGLHEFISEFINDTSRVSGAITEQYLM